MSAATDRYLTLARSKLPLDTVLLARYLLGKLLVRETPEGALSGRIVETEAYPIGDAAGHAHMGMTLRNRALFLSRGHAYIYLAYGTSYMINVSSEAVSVGAGVLIRALEPLDGIGSMQCNRGVQNLRDLTRGPGRLAAALDVDRRLDGMPSTSAAFAFGTSLARVFAVGDARAGAAQRIASAVGEGLVAIRDVHEYLGRLHDT